MVPQSSIEPFPPMAAHRIMTQDDLKTNGSTTRRRRASSGLGGEPRGDTGAPAVASMSAAEGLGSPPASPFGSRDHSHPQRGAKRRKAKTLFRRWKAMSLRNTWVNPLVLCLAIVGCYAALPTTDNWLRPFLFLSYPLPQSDPDAPIRYGKGKLDFCFIAFYTIFLSFTREFLMQCVIRPWAVRAGIKNRGKQARFMEQVYTAMYFAVLGPFGMYVMRESPVWYFNTQGMYEGFPHRDHVGIFKAYYLVQAAYWAQQMIVLLLMLEKPRKDFKELVAHHFVTLALIGLSYRFHFTHMGLAVYITHDISDFFLATSKSLNYLDSPVVAPYFFIFICAWSYLRHYINLKILFSILTEFRTIGPYDLNWETQQYKCWISQIITFALLAVLQAINIFWFFLIVRIAWRLVRKNEAVDERSEDEEDEDEAQEEQKPDGHAQQAVRKGETPVVHLNGVPVEENEKGPQEGTIRVRRSPRRKG